MKYSTKLKKYVRSGEQVKTKIFVKEMADLMGESVEVAQKAFDAYNDLIFQHMALENWIEMPYGVIGGYTKEPMKVTGFYNSLKSLQDPTRKHYTVAKSGFPFIIWSEQAEYSTITHPGIYYTEWIPQKYTTKAYNFRKELNYPEIPEYDGLSEEKIQELCKKADKQLYGEMSKKEKIMYNRQLKKSNKEKEIVHQQMILDDIEEQKRMGVENIKEKTIEEILEEKNQLWLNGKLAKNNGYKKRKGKGYKLPEKLKKLNITPEQIERVQKYDENDSILRFDDKLLEELKDKAERNINSLE